MTAPWWSAAAPGGLGMALSCSMSEELGLESPFGLKASAIVKTLVAKLQGTVSGGRDQQLLTQRSSQS